MLLKVYWKILVSFGTVQNFIILDLAMAKVKKVNIAVTYCGLLILLWMLVLLVAATKILADLKWVHLCTWPSCLVALLHCSLPTLWPACLVAYLPLVSLPCGLPTLWSACLVDCLPCDLPALWPACLVACLPELSA